MNKEECLMFHIILGVEDNGCLPFLCGETSGYKNCGSLMQNMQN